MHKLPLTLAAVVLLCCTAAAAPSASPFEGSYAGELSGWSLAIAVGGNGQISGRATPLWNSFCSNADVSGRITNDGDLKLVLSFTCVDTSSPRWRDVRVHWTIQGAATLGEDGSLTVVTDDVSGGGFTLEAR